MNSVLSVSSGLLFFNEVQLFRKLNGKKTPLYCGTRSVRRGLERREQVEWRAGVGLLKISYTVLLYNETLES